jgi:transcriptional regulator with XRE-family HTH domain
MPENLGARLRQRREEQGIALNRIAEQTKIKLSLLEALERDDVSHWPSGIFRRAYIRAYAHAINLNPDIVVREFLQVHPEPAEVVTTEALTAAVEGGRRNGGPPTRLRYIVGSAFGSLSRLRKSHPVESQRSAAARRPEMTAELGLSASSPSPEPDVAEWSLGSPRLSFDVEGQDGSNRAADRYAPLDEVGVFEPPAAEAAERLPAPPCNGAHVLSADLPPVSQAEPPDPDFVAVAHLCTELGRVGDPAQLQPLLQEAAVVLDAIGIIVWIWDAEAEGLRPVLVYGYSEKVLAQVPAVKPDAHNATAAAFRSARASATSGGEHTSGALVVPLLTPDGCAGVLAIELQHGRELVASVRAAATIFAALLAQLIGRSEPVEEGTEGKARLVADAEHDASPSYEPATVT